MTDATTSGATAPRGTGTRRYGLDLAEAFKRARAIIKDASGYDVVRESRKRRDPVERARRMAEVSAPADMRASIALTLGVTPDELERDKSGARLILEGTHKRLSIVGLRAGDSVEHDLSEKMHDVLARFYVGSGKRRALPAASDADVDADAAPE